jgi:signal transduction histidine kinase
MIRQVRQTLGTVTERLQQILHTVRRDPSRSELTAVDLNALIQEIARTWEDLAREKWKLTLTAELHPEPLWIAGDRSHLQQAVENLLFNARDATFEMRNHLREQARKKMAGSQGLGATSRKDGWHIEDRGSKIEDRPTAERSPTLDSRSSTLDPRSSKEGKQALITAAGWKGIAILRTRKQGDWAVLEVQDNGIGMNDEVRRRCTETHFSTKRDNAIYEGNTTGMGLGLSFVVVILGHHQARMEIESQPFQGALFRASFPLLATPK